MSGISFYIHGNPVPQGSKKVIRGNLIEMADARLRSWRQDISAAAHNAILDQGYERATTRPIAVRLAFILPRPKGHYGTGKNAAKLKPSAPDFPAVSPDLDKLIRAVLDALTGICFADDRQVVAIDAGKWYGDAPGLQAEVIPLLSANEIQKEREVADRQEQEDQEPA